MMYSPPVGGQKWALLISCLVLAGCPDSSSADSDTDGDDEGEDTTGSTTVPATTVPGTSMSASGTTTTDPPTTTDPTTDPSDTDTDTDTTESTTGPETMSCCEPHSTPSCDQEDVSTCVCKNLAECCVFEWDQTCVDEALDNCDAVCDEDTTGTTTGPSDCKLEQIELVAEDAVLTGDWFETTSSVGEGQILAVGGAGDGSVSWTVPITCADNWRIWIRSFDAGNDDSFFVTVDGEPDPPAIVESDCGPEPPFGEYRWSLMNWRDFDEPFPCEYLEDPWVHQFDEGDHVVEFSYREATAIGRIIVTNDPAFDPEA